MNKNLTNTTRQNIYKELRKTLTPSQAYYFLAWLDKRGVRHENKKINPIAKALLSLKKRVVPSKKGKGSYNRKKEKNIAKQI